MKTVRLPKKFVVAGFLLALACWLFPLMSLALPQNQQDKGKGQKAQPSRDADTVRIDTELVQIDIVVSDKQGKLISDLKREDFQILEDGKPQTISHFSVGTSGRQAMWLRPELRAAGNDKRSAPMPQVAFNAGRYLVLAVDDVHLAPGNMMLAKKALNKFLDSQVGATDQVAAA